MGQRCTWQAVSSNTQKAHTAHTHILDISFMPASLPGTALGPEGPRCRRRMGVGGWCKCKRKRGQKRRQVRESKRQWWHSVLNVTMVLKIPANLLAGNDMTGGIGEGRSWGRRERWQAGKDGEERDRKGDNKEEETKGGRLGQRVGGGGGLDGKDETDGGKQRQHFSSLLKGLPLMTDYERQNGHPNKQQYSGWDTQHQPFNTELSTMPHHLVLSDLQTVQSAQRWPLSSKIWAIHFGNAFFSLLRMKGRFCDYIWDKRVSLAWKGLTCKLFYDNCYNDNKIWNVRK